MPAAAAWLAALINHDWVHRGGQDREVPSTAATSIIDNLMLRQCVAGIGGQKMPII